MYVDRDTSLIRFINVNTDDSYTKTESQFIPVTECIFHGCILTIAFIIIELSNMKSDCNKFK